MIFDSCGSGKKTRRKINNTLHERAQKKWRKFFQIYFSCESAVALNSQIDKSNTQHMIYWQRKKKHGYGMCSSSAIARPLTYSLFAIDRFNISCQRFFVRGMCAAVRSVNCQTNSRSFFTFNSYFPMDQRMRTIFTFLHKTIFAFCLFHC